MNNGNHFWSKSCQFSVETWKITDTNVLSKYDLHSVDGYETLFVDITYITILIVLFPSRPDYLENMC